ncbi:uncharacterized protein LOC144425096 [Styela clava]
MIQTTETFPFTRKCVTNDNVFCNFLTYELELQNCTLTIIHVMELIIGCVEMASGTVLLAAIFFFRAHAGDVSRTYSDELVVLGDLHDEASTLLEFPVKKAHLDLQDEANRIYDINLEDLLSAPQPLAELNEIQTGINLYSTAFTSFFCAHFPCKYNGQCKPIVFSIYFSPEQKAEMKENVKYNVDQIKNRINDGTSEVAEMYSNLNNVLDAYFTPSDHSVNTESAWADDGVFLEYSDKNESVQIALKYIQLLVAQRLVRDSKTALVEYEMVKSVDKLDEIASKFIHCLCFDEFGGVHCQFCILNKKISVLEYEFLFHGIAAVA